MFRLSLLVIIFGGLIIYLLKYNLCKEKIELILIMKKHLTQLVEFYDCNDIFYRDER